MEHNETNNKNVSLSLISEYGASDSESEETESRSNGFTGNEDSDNTEHREMVLKNNIINACAHGPLSTTADRTDVDVTRHMIIDGSESGVVEYEVTEYRDMISESDLSSSSDSSDEDDSVDWIVNSEEPSSGDENNASNKIGKVEPIKVIGELGLDDLPPIEDLAISLPSQETTKIGTIASIVGKLVVVRAFPETPAVDLDSVLFLDSGARALGKVFDVFGPVTEPHYCVRFNSQDHVKEFKVEPGMEVFFAPLSTHTNYVFLSELMKTKGSDASWLNDVEPPPSHVDYSDDEEERRANKARKEQNKQNKQQDETENGETSKNQAPPKENRKNQRPSESSSRFGSGNNHPVLRGRLPYPSNMRRNNPNTYTRFTRPWYSHSRTPPSHLNRDPDPTLVSVPPFSFNRHPVYPPPFNPSTPPPFMGNTFQFGASSRMHGPIPPMTIPPPFSHNGPMFGSNFCNVSDSQHPWVSGPPPPPRT